MKYLWSCLLLLFAVNVACAQIQKSTGIMYFLDEPNITPNIAQKGGELAFSINTKKLWAWNRDSNDWFIVNDSSETNEIQSLLLSNDSLFLTLLNGEGVSLGRYKNTLWEITNLSDTTALIDSSVVINDIAITADNLNLAIWNGSNWRAYSGAGLYDRASPSTVTVGGLTAGTSITGLSWQEIIEDIVVMYLVPTFSSFSISGQTSPIEVGDSITGSKNFTWAFTNSGNVGASTVDIADLTTPSTLFTDISNTPPQAYNFTPSIRKTTATSHSWRGSATNTQLTNFNSSNFTVNWQFRRYWGWCPNDTPSDGEIMANSSELTTTKAKSTFNITVSGSNRYVYFAYPASFGDLSSLSVGGFESLPAFTKTTRSFTNAFGVSVSYNIYVSNNVFSVNVNNVITN